MKAKQKPEHTNNNTTKAKNTNNSDLYRKVEGVKVGLEGVRVKTSVYLDRKLWKSFKTLVKKEGLSTCDCLEKLILGFLAGYETHYRKFNNIYVTVDAPRVVKRVRRRQLIFEDEVASVKVEGGAGLKPCWYCGGIPFGRFRYKPTGGVYPLCKAHAGELLKYGVWERVIDE